MNLPPYAKFPALADNTITLREISVSDIGDIVEISIYDSVKARTMEEAVEIHEKISDDYRNGNSIHWGIALTSTNKIIGTVGYYRGFNGAGELGCVLLTQFRGQGLMTNALRLAVDFGFNTIGLNRIVALTTKQNHKAISLITRLGFAKTTDLQDDKVEYELKKKEM